MNKCEIETFDLFLWESFEKENMQIRELRLSEEEKLYIKEKYPTASFMPMSSGDCKDDKRWYVVSL